MGWLDWAWLAEKIASAVAAKLSGKFDAAVAKMEAAVAKIEGLRSDVSKLTTKVDALTGKVDLLLAGAGADPAQLQKLNEEITKAVAASGRLTDAMKSNPNP